MILSLNTIGQTVTDQATPAWVSQLPAPLLRSGPLAVLWWQWLALPVLITIASMAGWLLGRAVRAVIMRVVSRTKTDVDDVILKRLNGPLTGALSLVVVAALIPFVWLPQPANLVAYKIVRAGYFIVIFWTLWRLVDVAQHILSRSHWARNSSTSRALLPIATRATKIVVLAFASVAILSMFGYPVASLIAGLGLGGLAFALAAQKTVENLFGAFSIGVDRPFSEGDFVKVDNFVGTVESLGLRSTRFRTLDRTLISIPNGKLADMRLESFSVRDRMRLAATIGLVYDTTTAQLRQVLADLERVLRSHPKIWPDAVVVRLVALGSSSLDVEIMAWFQTLDYDEFQAIRQEVLIQFMEVVEKAGSAFAFPTQTLRVASMPTPKTA